MLKVLFLIVFSINALSAAPLTPNLGKPATKALIDAWNNDIFPDGIGLPAGHGNAGEGQALYRQYCLYCHGAEGQGGSADELAGAGHGLTDNPPDKTIGTYWPFATTIFDFIRRAMPLDRPGRLSNDQVYAVTAYLLYLNKLLPFDKSLDAKLLTDIKMPNRNGFIDSTDESK